MDGIFEGQKEVERKGWLYLGYGRNGDGVEVVCGGVGGQVG